MATGFKLAIGNKNYSSWSMRPWGLLRQAGIPFEKIPLWFDDAGRITEARGETAFVAAGEPYAQ